MNTASAFLIACVSSALFFGWNDRLFGQESPPIEESRNKTRLPLSEFRPIPKLNVDSTLLTRAKFPVIDVHSHFFIRFRHDPVALREYVALMDRNNIAVSVSLDGTLGRRLDEHISYLWTEHRNRFVIFANIDWENHGRASDTTPTQSDKSLACLEPGFVESIVEQLRLAKERGVSGLKIFKQMGLQYKDSDGRFLMVDDSRWEPIWEACGRLGLPVIMHTADPTAFFEPINVNNERYEELERHPEWSYFEGGNPSRRELHEARNRVIERHPKTTFIAAHFGNDAEDLKITADWLERFPNLYVEFASRISELGRQPTSSKRFFEKYADRIMFGTDGPWPELRLQRYWRFLETDDEYFPYSEKEFPPQGLWNIYGICLSDEVLRKVYFENACRIIPGVKERLDSSRQTEPRQALNTLSA